MKIKVIEDAKIIMSNPQGMYKYFGWPTAMRLQNGKIAVGASGYRMSHICPFGKAVISYSEDEGKTYTRPAIVIDGFLDDRDGGLCTFGEKGLILTSFNNENALQLQFIDGHCCKRTEEEKKYILSYLDLISPEQEAAELGAYFKISYDCGITFSEKTYKSPITSPHGPIELQDGTILWVGTVKNYSDGNPEQIRAWSINPQDGSMAQIGMIPNVTDDEGKAIHLCEPYAVQLKDGTIVCHIRVEPAFTTYQTVSKDNGKTWSVPEPLLPKRGGAPAFLYEHSSGVLISVYGYRNSPYGVRAMFSKDGGKTWDTDNIVYATETSGDLGYPSVVELEDGSLLTVFYARESADPWAPSVIMQTIWSFEEE